MCFFLKRSSQKSHKTLLFLKRNGHIKLSVTVNCLNCLRITVFEMSQFVEN
ncbi:hypothetical protein Hanom_Chr06g00527591 [Helianthus anomalus]